MVAALGEEITRNCSAGQVTPRTARSQSARRVRRSVPRARGTLPHALLLSSAGHTFLMTAWFCCGTTLRETRRTPQSMPSNSRPAASQATKSASISRVTEARGGGGLVSGLQSLRCRRIFSMMSGPSMKLMMRKRPPHLGQASGSAYQKRCTDIPYPFPLSRVTIHPRIIRERDFGRICPEVDISPLIGRKEGGTHGGVPEEGRNDQPVCPSYPLKGRGNEGNRRAGPPGCTRRSTGGIRPSTRSSLHNRRT